MAITVVPVQPAMAITSRQQKRGHAGHHHHNHSHDNSYLTSTNRQDAGVRITRIGLYVNLAMAVGKGIGGYVFHSQGTPSHHASSPPHHYARQCLPTPLHSADR
jgi:hypothetical protein